jgi:hypothetical protein
VKKIEIHSPFYLSLIFAFSALPLMAHQNKDSSGSYPERNEVGATAAVVPGDKPRCVGSPYVDLHSWVYPAIERLAALRYMHDQFLGMRSWTRGSRATSFLAAKPLTRGL